jgi:hypothetical protein
MTPEEIGDLGRLGRTLWAMRKTLAAVVAVVALGGAVYFGSLHLGASRFGDCLVCARPTRAFWQFPVAVAIASLGLVVAVGVLKRT